MVHALLLAGKIAFAAAGAAAAWSLARTARREGRGDLGRIAAMIGVGGLGLVAFGVGTGLGAGRPRLATALMVAGDGGERLALALLLVFVWRVFRPGSGGAVSAGLGAGVLLATGVWELATQPYPAYDPGLAAAQASQMAFALPFAWSAVETGLAFRRARRQAALGLVEPAVCARFWLWSLACTAFVAICALAVAAEAGGPTAACHAVRGLLYAAIAALVWVGFFPPALWRRRVEASARFGGAGA